jgi:Ser/Thr protein kinase RdoA (MazF antagonist)
VTATAERDRIRGDELAIVLSHYDLGLVHEIRVFPRGSHRAPKVLIRSDRGAYLLKRRPEGKNDPYRVAFAHELQNYLAEHNFPLPHLIGTREENNSMLRLGDSVYEIFEYIEGERYDQGLLATYEAGKILGLYHRLVHEFHSEWEPPRGHYHNADMVRNFLRGMPQRLSRMLAERPASAGSAGEGASQDRSFETTPEAIERITRPLLEIYDKAARKADELGLPNWEKQIIHSDWHPGNMLFRTGHVVAVIDYDAARIAPRILDVGNGVLQFSLVTGPPEPEAWPEYADEPRAKRFLRGYDEMNVLTVAELGCVPWMMSEALIAEVVVPVWNTGRFARLDGFRFLKMILRKVEWLVASGSRLVSDLDE